MDSEITPNEILHKSFSRSFRGLKTEDVKSFLKDVALEIEELLRKNMFLQDKVKQLEDAIEEYRQMEGTLKNTLVSSQRVGQEIKDEAERKSNLIIRETELEAERIISKAKQRKERLEEETFQLLNQHKRFRAEFVSLIESHGKMIKAQDSRVLLGFNLGEPENSPPEPQGEVELANEEEATMKGKAESAKSEVGEEEIKDLEILFPEEKE